MSVYSIWASRRMFTHFQQRFHFSFFSVTSLISCLLIETFPLVGKEKISTGCPSRQKSLGPSSSSGHLWCPAQGLTRMESSVEIYKPIDKLIRDGRDIPLPPQEDCELLKDGSPTHLCLWFLAPCTAPGKWRVFDECSWVNKILEHQSCRKL